MCGNYQNKRSNRKSIIEKTYSVIVGPDDKEQRAMILEYISNHHGCLLREIIKNFEKKIGEKKVSRLVGILDKLGLIENKSKNKRDKVYYIKKENEFFKTDKKIKIFSKKYSLLLKHCEDNYKLAKIKNELNQEKKVSLEPEQNRKGFKLIISEYHKSEKIFDRIYYLIIKIDQCFNEISNLEEEVFQSSSQKIMKHNGTVSTGIQKNGIL